MNESELTELRVELVRLGVRVSLAGTMRERDAARYLGVSPRTLQHWRQLDRGPPYQRLARRMIVYPLTELVEWQRNAHVLPGSTGLDLDRSPTPADHRRMTQRLSIEVHPAVASTLRDLAQQRGISTSELLAEALRNYQPAVRALTRKIDE